MQTTPLASATAARLDGWPLLVLDAGAFLARCRWCGWASPRRSTLEAALANFGAHACEEPSG
jgi:hypothetical protein